MAKVRLVGDIHGKLLPYLKTIEGVDRSIQIGDFGFGFGTKGRADFIDSQVNQVPGYHRFIRGNHDNPEECAKSTNYIPDGTVEDGVFFLGGAGSIDRQWRTEGVDWWPGEELSNDQLGEMVALYEKHKPNLLITHECSEFFANEVMIPRVGGIKNFRSRTRDAIDTMYAIRPPQMHVFGHWHLDTSFQYEGTRMICLGELSYMDVEMDHFA